MEQIQEIQQAMQKSKQDLLQQKDHIESQIKILERKQQDGKLKDVMIKMQDISHSLTNMQNNLNMIWKRTQQVQEEVNSLLQSTYEK